MIRSLLVTLILILPAVLAAAQEAPSIAGEGAAPRVGVQLVWRQAPLMPGDQNMLGVVLNIDPRWHVQAGEGSPDYKPPYIPTTIKLELPPGWSAGKVTWPEAEAFFLGTSANAESLAGYGGQVLAAVPITVPADASGDFQFSATVGYQACDYRQCEFPQTVPIQARARVGAQNDTRTAAPQPYASLFAATLGESVEPTPPPVSGGESGEADHIDVPDSIEFPVDQHAVVQLATNPPAMAAGESGLLGIIINVQPKWHIQAPVGSPALMEGGIGSELTIELPDGVETGDVDWPAPAMFNLAGIEAGGFGGRLLVLVPFTISENVAIGEHDYSVKLKYQACDDLVCDFEMEFIAEGALSVTSAADAAAAPPLPADIQELFARRSDPATSSGGASIAAPAAGLLGLLLLAMLGGFVLNLTPCVLPVIPLKIMGLANSGGSRSRTLILGIAMALGIVAFFVALGTAIVSINTFTAANQLFQYPAFTIGVGLVIGALAIGMCGFFTFRLPSAVYRLNPSHDTLHGSFLFGVMTAVLSTPCTAPFMGGAMAASIGQGTVAVLVVFGSVGFGMALPYLVLAARPELAAKMPRTGPASELIKQVMGLLMLAAAAYFVGVGISGLMVSPPEPPSRMYFWGVALFIVGAAAWLGYRTLRITISPKQRGIWVSVATVLLVTGVLGAATLSKPDSRVKWVYYTPERLAEALAQNKAVAIEFTAEWCLNCKYLEKTVLNTDSVADRLNSDDIVPIKVDLTGNNTFGRELLQETGSLTIPWLVIMKPSRATTFAENFYTPGSVLEAIEEATKQEVARADSAD